MLTTAITAALTALLASLGVEPGLYVAPMWVAVKLLIVTPLVGGGMLVLKKRMAEQEAAQTPAAPAPETAPPDGA